MKYRDKISHFAVCYVLADGINWLMLLGVSYLEISDQDYYVTRYIAGGISIVIGGLYEIYQGETGFGKKELGDWFADIAGVLVWFLTGII